MKTIYVDVNLPADCLNGEYSIANRDNSGSDGIAYRYISAATGIAQAGDNVLIRGGQYGRSIRMNETDVIWPKNSGTEESPIVIKNYANEKVRIGGKGNYPNDSFASIARGAITLKDVSYITIEGIEINYVAGWLFGRNVHHITLDGCIFEDARWDSKATAVFVESHHIFIRNCTMKESASDCLLLTKTDYCLIENNTFYDGKHSCVAFRGCNYLIFRGNSLRNKYNMKIMEIYDCKLDTRDPANPKYTAVPAYNSAQHNVLIGNFFGPHGERQTGRIPSIQFSAQNTIVACNAFFNHLTDKSDVDFEPGGQFIHLNWGGSCSGWDGENWVGSGFEAGYVYGNRIFHNLFYGGNHGVTRTSDTDLDTSTTSNLAKYNPPPMDNVKNYTPYTERYKFSDNEYKNNVFWAGRLAPSVGWTHVKDNIGRPVQFFIMVKPEEILLRNNCFWSEGEEADMMIYNHIWNKYRTPESPLVCNDKYETFSDNIIGNPNYADVNNADFKLLPASSLIGRAAYLTNTVEAGTGRDIKVADATYFYDGFGLTDGVVIQIEGSNHRAMVIGVDYENNILTVDTDLTWGIGKGVTYACESMDIGLLNQVVVPSQPIPEPEPEEPPVPEPEPEPEPPTPEPEPEPVEGTFEMELNKVKVTIKDGQLKEIVIE